MAIFRGDDFNRLDWRLLQSGAISLYYRPSILQEDVVWLVDHGYLLYEFNCATWICEGDFHDAVSATLKFPEYYGRNSAAFNDCLGDLEIPEEGGAVLVFNRFHRFAARDEELAIWLLDAIQQNARRHLLWGRRLLALLQSDDPRLRIEPVGACAPNWNPREWSDSARGL
jgi:RNAse (barnase) inhibitor barstar